MFVFVLFIYCLVCELCCFLCLFFFFFFGGGGGGLGWGDFFLVGGRCLFCAEMTLKY